MSLQVWLPLNGSLDNQGLSGLTATYNSGATVNNSGKIGKCYSFTTSQLIQTTLSNQVTSPVGSLSCWVKFNSFPSSGQHLCLLKLGNVGSGFGSSLLSFWMSGNQIEVVVKGGDPTSVTQITNPFSTNIWYQLVITYNGTTAKVYSNGAEIYSKAISGGSLTNANYLLIGASNANTAASPSPNYGLNGYLNDVRYYDHALSVQEVKKLAQGLILHYPLDGFYNGCNPNLLKNGRFYQGLENWPISSNTISIETNGGQYGHDCLRMEITNGGIVTPRQSTQFSLKGNTIYTVTVIAKTISGDFSNYYIRVANTLSFSLISITNLNNDWKKYIYQYTPSADINLTNVIGFAGSGSIIVLISEIKLEEDSRSTPWMPHISEFSYQYNTVYDISGYKNHGTIIGSLIAAAGSPRYKSCIVNNDTSYITCPQLFGEIQTISFWLKSDKSNGCFIIEPNSKLGFCISNNLLLISRWLQLTYDATSFISDEWNHIVLVKTGESTALLYINGVEITTRGSNSNNIAHTVSVPWLFWRSYNENYHGIGSMSDVRIYATALSADEVAELYALGQV